MTEPQNLVLGSKLGYAVDPAIFTLLDKAARIQLAVRQIDLQITELQGQIEHLKFTRDVLSKQK